jgi:diacylglycerol kinase family enzyme
MPLIHTAQVRPDYARRVAVMLNRNAAKVSTGLVADVARVVPKDDLFVTRTLEDARGAARTILRRRYGTLLLGGGDGTVTRGITDLVELARAEGVPLPRFGVLPCGTGNSMAEALDARDTFDVIERAARMGVTRPIEMLSVEGRLAPFAGCGLDAQILDDYSRTSDALAKVGLGLIPSGLGRYSIAVATRSIPRYVGTQISRSGLAEVTAVNAGSPAYRIGDDGRPTGNPIAAGDVLWSGRCALASAATIPYYGFGLKMFPFAGKIPHRFQLRMSDAGTASILANLPGLFAGTWRSPRIHDFFCDKVTIYLEREGAFQVGGDLLGPRKSVTVGMASTAIDFVG